MIESRLLRQTVKRVQAARLRIGAAEDQTRDTGLEDRADAHDARLERDVDRAFLQPPAFEARGRGLDGENFRMSERALPLFTQVMRAREHGVVRDDNRTDGDFACGGIPTLA